MEFLTKGLEPVFRNGLSHILHKLQVKMKIMDRVQAQRQNLLSLIKVPEVGAAVMPASITQATGLDGQRIFRIFGIFDDDLSGTRKKGAVASVPRGQNAVEHIHTVANRF